MANAADLIARRLYAAGCRNAFGIPGGEVLTLIRSLAEAGIEFVLAKHENPAGFMAEGTYHASGAPGVLVATLGPGVANAVNVVANAWQDRVPLLFLTGCVDPKVSVGYTHQVFDHAAMLRPVTKASLTVVDGAVDAIVDKALNIALDDPPGPVHLDLPISVAAARQPDRAPVRRGATLRGGPAPGPALETARQWLKEATRPLVIGGVEVLNHSAEQALANFCRGFGLPLITTYKAKGVLPEDDPLSLGGAGLSPKADGILLPLLALSDLIILAGYDPVEMRAGWCNPWPADTRVVELAAVPNTHYVHQASLSFVGDVGAGLRALSQGLARKPGWSGGEPARARQAMRGAFTAGDGWGPGAVIEVARRVLPRNTVATADSGAHRILLSQMWECYEPRQLLQSSGFCTMGCALPLATGYKRVNTDRPVVAFIGDACLEMTLGELATLRDARTPVIVVVFVDESLALIELKQRESGMQNLGVDFPGTDFVGVAAAVGMPGAWVSDRNSLEAELGAALAREMSTLIACRIDRKSYDGTF